MRGNVRRQPVPKRVHACTINSYTPAECRTASHFVTGVGPKTHTLHLNVLSSSRRSLSCARVVVPLALGLLPHQHLTVGRHSSLSCFCLMLGALWCEGKGVLHSAAGCGCLWDCVGCSCLQSLEAAFWGVLASWENLKDCFLWVELA